MACGMSVNDLVLVQGMADTKLALSRWNERPWTVLRPWLRLSFGIAVLLLAVVYVIAKLTTPDSSRYILPGVNSDAGLDDYVAVLFRNSLVLALHAMACVAGFIAGSAMPLSASQRSGFSRAVHEKAGTFAIVFVLCATTFSLATQAYVIGSQASTIALQLGITPGELILTLLPHAIPELVALFLPLAAWIIASRRDEWHDLLAANAVTVAIAVPTLLMAAAIEIWVSPLIMEAVSTHQPPLHG
jgi:uncharacterized membrane protein SpoIIM required for sporulation